MNEKKKKPCSLWEEYSITMIRRGKVWQAVVAFIPKNYIYI